MAKTKRDVGREILDGLELRFEQIDDVDLRNFGHQNVIDGISLISTSVKDGSRRIAVEFIRSLEMRTFKHAMNVLPLHCAGDFHPQRQRVYSHQTNHALSLLSRPVGSVESAHRRVPRHKSQHIRPPKQHGPPRADPAAGRRMRVSCGLRAGSRRCLRRVRSRADCHPPTTSRAAPRRPC